LSKIDEIDAKILKTLLKDARTKFSDIAKECKVSTTAIANRFKKLKQTGIITGTSLRVNMENFGFKFVLSIEINIDHKQEKQIIETLNKLPNLISCYSVIGKYDIHAAVHVKSLEQINEIKNLIRTQKGVKKIGVNASLDKFLVFPENILIEPIGT